MKKVFCALIGAVLLLANNGSCLGPGGVNSAGAQRACAAASVAGATADVIAHDIGAVYTSAKVAAIIQLVQLGQAIIQANCQVIINQPAPAP